FVSARDRWLEAERARPVAAGQFGSARGFRWILAYAAPASTAEDGREGLAVLHDYLPLPSPFTRMESEGVIGRVFLLAGRPLEAIPYLRAAASECSPVTYPFAAPRAANDLGLALEATGDRKGACEAYARVLARWPSGQTRSKTAA